MSQTPTFTVVAARIERDGRFLITQRRPQAVLPLLWEFPGGKVEPGETEIEALRRELRHRINVEIGHAVEDMEVQHPYAGYTLCLRLYTCQLAQGCEPQAVNCNDLKWVLPEELAQHEFPGADQATVDQLLGR
ncbi:MAG: (deoxy)nucleoside triphosphate pyrophosphohydrolase [Myxococcota bacterium]|nr:(deoxy)nucleoside triphosphate pyrophosphohydrolase [Myxococcota bacterium]